jgi:hydrogenase expression/formation protein HypE
VLNEFAQSSGVGIRLDEESLPVRDAVRGVCEILGLDALYLANEGKLAAVVPAEAAGRTLAAMRAHPGGADSRIIGEVIAAARPRVTLRTAFGSERVVDMLVGEQLPRIC